MVEREHGTIKVEIVKHFGVLSTAPTGWTKELNLVKWNDRPEKYDIRDWAPDHERMSKGITLFDYEMEKIAELCTALFNEEPRNMISTDTPTSEEGSADGEEMSSGVEPQYPDKVAEGDIPF